MNVANSAKAVWTLGATLILFTAPEMSFAGIEGANVDGIEGANILGIEGANVDGIEGANILGIEGANVDGIEGANILGIEGANVDGIEGANILGIEGANVDGIEGANILGIEGANVDGIEGANILGIEGANVDGIEGANVDGIEGANTDGIEGANIDGIEGANGDAVLIGVVDSIDRNGGVFESLGQKVMVSDDMMRQLSEGDLVSVQGSIAGPGLLYADTVSVAAEQYVPGATRVYVTGILSSIDASTGTAMLGALRVDYTASMSSGKNPEGAVWSFRGTQPAERGVMLSDDVNAY